MNGIAPQRKLLTTGQVASLCAVTPDAVLKWIKSGKLPAHRTPGGHYRIQRKDVFAINSFARQSMLSESKGRSFQYCWEFNSDNGKINEDCHQCIVYNAKALRCYEMTQLESEHSRSFCTISCEECDYYKLVKTQRVNVLFVSNRDDLRESLESKAGDLDFNIRFTDCEYSCSMLIENYRPDYVSIDCSLGVERSLEFAMQLKIDPRIPFVRIIMVGDRDEIPQECDKEVFALLERPFKLEVLQKLINNIAQRSLDIHREDDEKAVVE